MCSHVSYVVYFSKQRKPNAYMLSYVLCAYAKASATRVWFIFQNNVNQTQLCALLWPMWFKVIILFRTVPAHPPIRLHLRQNYLP